MDAPEAVRDELVKAVGLIASQPTCGSPIASRRFRGLRRVHLARIDYHVYYRLAPRLRQVEILAFWHARRGSSPHL